MDVDGAQFDVAVLPPDAVEQLPARKYPTGMLHEMAQQAEFGRSHRDDLPRAHHLVRDRIEFDIGIAQHLAGERGAQAAQQRLDARDQLARTERSEEHTSELKSLMHISYAVFCL